MNPDRDARCDDLGDHVTAITSWNVGDLVIRGPGEHYAVVNVTDLSDDEESPVRGLLHVEPLEG